MARCSFADWHRVPGSEPAITPTQFIFHTAVMRDLFDLEAFFSGPSGGIESHFGVGGKWGRSLSQDGQIRQWRDTQEQADANRQANARAISVETCDNAPRSADDIEPWTQKQLASLVRLGIWARRTHNIPARICRTPTDSGFGWHAMWDNTAFEFADGSTPWTPSAGKVCPARARIKQLKEIVLPAIFAGKELEEDMTPEEHDLLVQAANDAARVKQAIAIGSGPDAPLNQDEAFSRLFYRVSAINNTLNGSGRSAFIAELATALAPLIPGGGLTQTEVETLIEDILNRTSLSVEV